MQIAITYSSPADQRRHDTYAALLDMGDAAEALARELTALIDEQFPIAQEAEDAADLLWRGADGAAGAIWQLAGLLRRTARRI